LLNQGYEFFKSFNSISIKTNPLLQFYGCSNLAKVLILTKGVKKGIESLDQSHGLKFILDRSNIDDLRAYEVQVLENGTFIELLGIFDRKTPISRISNLRFNLFDLLNRYVDIYDYFETRHDVIPIAGFHIQENPQPTANSFPIGVEKKFSLFVYLLGGDKKENFEKYKQKFINMDFGRFVEHGMRVYPGSNPEHFPIKCFIDTPDDLPNIDLHKNYENQSFIISPIENNSLQILFSQIEIQYLISFIYSNLVRYYADVWERVIESFEHSWIINKSIDYISRSYPNNILNTLIYRNCVVLNPGVLTRRYNIDSIK